MSAGTAYTKRYGGGFVDLPTTTTAIDSAFLNAVETALLQLLGAAPTADGQVAQWDTANTRFGPALILNKNVDAAAAIAKSKLDFSGANGLVNADVAGAAAIARSKLDFGSGLVNTDVAAAAAIAYAKLALTGSIVNADIAGAAAIAASKLAGYPTDATKVLKGDGSWAGAMTLITSVTLGGSSLLDFTGIPQTFKHLKILYELGYVGTPDQIMYITFNGDAGANYYWDRNEITNGAQVIASAAASTVLQICMAGDSAGYVAGEITIPNYAATVLKSAFAIYQGNTSANRRMGTGGGRWAGASANVGINRIQMSAATGQFGSGGICSIYGIG